MSRADKFVIIISLAAILLTGMVSSKVFDDMAHIEDEMAYVWQAQTIAEAGRLTLPTPVCPRCFLVPFVDDYQGIRFGKYPPAWPVVLAIGIRLGLRQWINPFLAGLAVWLTYRLGKKLFNEWVGIVAALLTLSSPFFLINSGSLLSHPWALVLSLTFVIGWLDTFFPRKQLPKWMTAGTAGFSLGLLALTRPLTAAGVALPFFIHGLYLLIRGDRQKKLWVIRIGLLTGVLAGLILVWQYSLTGNPFLNPYTLWWPYDKVGFGPGVGLQPGGYHLLDARTNIKRSLWMGSFDLFGWFNYSWIFLPFGLAAIRRNKKAWLTSLVFPGLIAAYVFYWIGSWLYGPRYYYEGLFSLTLLTAAGISLLSGLPLEKGEKWLSQNYWKKLQTVVVLSIVSILVILNLRYYLPARLHGMTDLYNVGEQYLKPFQTQQALSLTPALIIVEPQVDWIEYGRLIELESPLLNTPFIFIHDRGPEANSEVMKAFPDRTVIYYYPTEPYHFYLKPKTRIP